MRYYSTKNKDRFYTLQEAVLLGLPADNGLFMPESVPVLEESFIRSLHGKSLKDIAGTVARAWFGQEVPEAELDQVRDAVRDCMENVHKLDVPLLVEVGAGLNWDKAH